MDNQRNIIWLASYPKSGNTWFRVFLTNLLNAKDQPASINSLDGAPIASSRVLFDEATGLDSSDLTPDEIDWLRPEVYRFASRQSSGPLVQKIHDAWQLVAPGNPLIPEDTTRAVIYFIRDPRDVALSFAHHSAVDHGLVVQRMNDENYAFCSKTSKLHNQLRQKLNTWSQHVISWVDQSGLPVHVVRYEDMKMSPLETFRKATRFAGLDYPDEEILRALRNSDFEVLKQQEQASGFKEKPEGMISFFRKGISGGWKQELDPALATRIETDHGDVMKRFGYGINE